MNGFRAFARGGGRRDISLDRLFAVADELIVGLHGLFEAGFQGFRAILHGRLDVLGRAVDLLVCRL